MKIEPRRVPPDRAAPQEPTTTEFESPAGLGAYRRTTVTVERETLSFLVRQPVGRPADQPANDSSRWQR